LNAAQSVCLSVSPYLSASPRAPALDVDFSMDSQKEAC
jgi:hypothetical protein